MTVDGPTDWTTPGAFEIRPDLYRIPLPLPGDSLRAVNVYAMLDDTGVAIIDSGWAMQSSREQLEAGLRLIDRSVSDIGRIAVTHLHRDHYTQAVHLRREFGSRVLLGQGEMPSMNRLLDQERSPLAAQIGALEAGGAPELAAEISAHMHRLDPVDLSLDWQHPDEWLAPGPVGMGGHRLDAIATPGHTQGHLVFHDAGRGLLFAGDHVLPTITPSIGFEPVLGRDPLGDFLRSLAVMLELPDAELLPAHGLPGGSVHARVHQLLEHHDRRLTATEDHVRAGASSAHEVAREMRWTRHERTFESLDAFNRMLAVIEIGTHLDLLVLQKRCTVEVVDGVRRYQVA